MKKPYEFIVNIGDIIKSLNWYFPPMKLSVDKKYKKIKVKVTVK